MTIRKDFRIIILLVSSVFGCTIYYNNYISKQGINLNHILNLPQVLIKSNFDINYRSGYVIFNPSCKMLDPNPWNESIKKYIWHPRPLHCSHLPILTYVEQLNNLSNVLKINKKVIKKYKVPSISSLKCCYFEIERVNQSPLEYNLHADSSYTLSNCTYFEDQVILPNNTEFIAVSCLKEQITKGKISEKIIYKDVHPVVPILPEVIEKMEKFTENKKIKSSESDQSEEYGLIKEKLNVVIIGIDSVSKLNLRRIMPKTLKFLQQNNWVELNGYNKIGENTFPNLMAILSGKPMSELEPLCWTNQTLKMDDCPFLWKEYSKRGYITLYAEDTPAISTFNLRRTGFVEKPTDYYMRPFMQAAHDLLNKKSLNGLPVCLGQVLIVDHVFDYAKRFLRAFNNYNYFSLLWLNSLSHNDVNAPQALDISLSKFLNDLTNVGTYNNTLILLLSDHGVRFGQIRETFFGYLEERLPFMFIWFPDWFKEKYSNKYKYLLTNQNRLTSPYDIYVTLRRLLPEEESEYETNLDKPISAACPKCNGLLEPQPFDRTCADAAIDINWCMCSEFRVVSVKDPKAVQIGKFLYRYILNETANLIETYQIKKSLCSKWKFLRVFRIDEIMPPQNVLNKTSDVDDQKNFLSDSRLYVIIIELNPGKTKFEATVQMTTGPTNLPSFEFLEHPKRLDSVYKTSKCVNNISLKHYCYCVRR